MADSLFSRALKAATGWLKQYGLYMAALIGVVAAYESYFSGWSGESKGLLVAGSLAPVLAALFGQTLPDHLRRRRVQRLKVRAKDDYAPPPYEEGDEGFTRASGLGLFVAREAVKVIHT